ncbi:hypothetical protein D3C87_1898100 [compost metagenome]
MWRYVLQTGCTVRHDQAVGQALAEAAHQLEVTGDGDTCLTEVRNIKREHLPVLDLFRSFGWTQASDVRFEVLVRHGSELSR